MIVRARLKSLSEIPARYLCCESGRRSFRVDDVFVETTLVRIALDKCAFCGIVRGPSSGMAIVGEPGEIIVDCYELDEGETTPAEFLRHA